MKKILLIIMSIIVILGSHAPIAKAHNGLHFHCSICGAHDHGAMWHDPNKDTTNGQDATNDK